MKIITLLIVLSILVKVSFAQKTTLPKEFYFVKDANSVVEPYFISSKPITNREYICYLLWVQKVYSYYPIVLNNAIPRTENMVFFDNQESLNNSYLQNLINGLTAKDRGYVFNPKYLDYPIVGLSWLQAMQFCKWLSDRYNEHVLIKNRVIQFDAYQQNKDCYVTESFVAGQYMCLADKNYRIISMDEGLLIPSFRLPTKSELEMAIDKTSSDFKPYKMYSFLSPWITETRKGDTVYLSFGEPSENNYIKLESIQSELPKAKEELLLDEMQENKGLNISELFENIGLGKMDYKTEGQIQKDSLGQMTYIFIARQKQELVAVRNFSTIKPSKYKLPENKIFRIVLNVNK